MSNFKEEIQSIVSLNIANKEVTGRFLERLQEGNFTRDENPKSHYCVYFLPYNAKTKQVFIIHHKKSGLWLSPGGHIDQGELPIQTLNREIGEELGIKYMAGESIRPFLLTIVHIIPWKRPCEEHLDIWYRIPTDGSEFRIDPSEFHATKWATIEEARQLITDAPNREALDVMEKFFLKK